jgi:hypothetical protein
MQSVPLVTRAVPPLAPAAPQAMADSLSQAILILWTHTGNSTTATPGSCVSSALLEHTHQEGPGVLTDAPRAPRAQPTPGL